MKKLWFISLVLGLTACSTTTTPERLRGHLIDGQLVPIIPARVDNPLRTCRSYAGYADLSQPRPLRAYIEDDTGDLCRR